MPLWARNDAVSDRNPKAMQDDAAVHEIVTRQDFGDTATKEKKLRGVGRVKIVAQKKKWGGWIRNSREKGVRKEELVMVEVRPL